MPASSSKKPRAVKPMRIWVSRRAALASVTLLTVVCLGSHSLAIDYNKTFYFNNVKAKASISAGGQAQTSIGAKFVTEELIILKGVGKAKDVTGSLIRLDTVTDTQTINGGFPIKPAAGVNVDTKGGYSPPEAVAKDKADQQNVAKAKIQADQRVVGNGPVVNLRLGAGKGTSKVTLVDSVKATITGSTNPGVAKDKPFHAASSATAVAIDAAATFAVTAPGAIPTIDAIEQNLVLGGAITGTIKDQPKEKPGFRDPYFVTINDLTAGVQTNNVVMKQDLNFQNAEFKIDAFGISLAIALTDPDSFVDFRFSSFDDLGWVQNPYDYGARLDYFGFSSFGELASGWIVTSDSTKTYANYSFGPEGNPFDYAMVRPPDSFFEIGHEYSINQGGSESAYSFTAAVPEPATLHTLSIALSALATAHYLRKRKKNRGNLSLNSLRSGSGFG